MLRIYTKTDNEDSNPNRFDLPIARFSTILPLHSLKAWQEMPDEMEFLRMHSTAEMCESSYVDSDGSI